MVQTQGEYAVTDKVKLDAESVTVGGAVWSVGAVYRKTLTFDLRYEDTDLSRRECGLNPDVCGGVVVGKLTVALPPLMPSAKPWSASP